jgi:bacterioferritin-associated ferredoxin
VSVTFYGTVRSRGREACRCVAHPPAEAAANPGLANSATRLRLTTPTLSTCTRCSAAARQRSRPAAS